jgi:multiple sugar transport system permease protein
MAGPGLLLIGLFLVLPFFLALALTFTDQRLISPNPTSFVGLENYDRLLHVRMLTLEPEQDSDGNPKLDEAGKPVYPALRGVLRADRELRRYRPLFEIDRPASRIYFLSQDPVFWRSLLNTMLFAIIVVPLQCGMALGMALLVNQAIAGRNFFRTIYFAPVVTSMVVVSILWSFIFGKDQGLLNELLASISLGRIGPIHWLGEALVIPAIAVMSAWQGAGFQMLIFLAGLQGISRELYDAAAVDGASRWQAFRNVTLPSLRNTTIFVVISTTILAFGLFSQVDVMTRGGPNDASSTVIYHMVRTGFREQNIGYGSTISVVYFLLVLAVALVQRRLIDREKRT